jgi:hypothetical protein
MSATRFLLMVEDADGRWTEVGRVTASDERGAFLAVADRVSDSAAFVALLDNDKNSEIRFVHPLTRVEARDAETSGPLATEHGGSDAN